MITLFLKSMLIGIANIIPGVSGGTVAVILNVYDDILTRIGNFFSVNFKTKVEYVKYLLVVFLGVIFGILAFAKLINFSIINYPKITSTFFSILILFSLPYIVKGLNYKDKKNIISFVLGMILILIFIYFNIKYDKHSENIYLIQNFNFTSKYLTKILICGILAAGAMIIPGISGSLLLLMIGEYYNVVSFVNNFYIKPLFFLGIGVVIGIIIFSKIISYLLKKYKEPTLFFIAGIISLSVIQIWLNI